jgi:DNA-binding XRE family transcriptional regulator
MGKLKTKPKRTPAKSETGTRMGREILQALDEVKRFLQGEQNGVKVTRVTLTPLQVTVRELLNARDAAGMTTADVAVAAGLPVATVTRLEKGRVKRPTVDVLERYAKAVGRELRLSVVAAGK